MNEAPTMASESDFFLLIAGFVAVVGLFFAGIGAWLLRSAIEKYRSAARHDEFVPTEAEILTSDLTASTGTQGGGKHYVPEIEYEYTVEGTTYTSDSVYPGTDFDIQAKSVADSLMEAYPAGSVVEAYYDPDDPTSAFLETRSEGTKAVLSLAMAGGCLFLTLGLITGAVLLAVL